MNTTGERPALIIGAGIGGLIAAIALRRAGWANYTSALIVIENRSRTWRALEILRWMFANLHDPLDETRMELWIGCVMGS